MRIFGVPVFAAPKAVYRDEVLMHLPKSILSHSAAVPEASDSPKRTLGLGSLRAGCFRIA